MLQGTRKRTHTHKHPDTQIFCIEHDTTTSHGVGPRSVPAQNWLLAINLRSLHWRAIHKPASASLPPAASAAQYVTKVEFVYVCDYVYGVWVFVSLHDPSLMNMLNLESEAMGLREFNAYMHTETQSNMRRCARTCFERKHSPIWPSDMHMYSVLCDSADAAPH